MLRFAFDMIVSNLKKYILSVLLMSISLLLIMFSLLIYKGEQYSYISCNDALNKGIDGTAVLRLDENSFIYNQEVKTFLKEAFERKEIYCIGSMVDYGCTYESLNELYEIQRGHVQDYEIALQDDLIEIKMINSYAMPLCNLKLKEGIPIEELEFKDLEKIEYLYLGAAYEDIAVGTAFTEKDGKKFVVAGVIEENQRWILSSLVDTYTSEILDYTIDCNYEIFLVTNQDVFSSGLWICAEDGYTIEQAIDAAKEVGKKYDIKFSYDTLMDKVNRVSQDTALLLSYLTKLLGIVMVASLLMIITTQIVTMLESSKNYGVMYAVGFSRREVNRMLLWKHIITAITSLVITIPLCMFVAQYRFANDDMNYMIKTVLSTYVFPAAIIVAIVIVIIMHIVTCAILKRLTPVKLIHGKVV